MSAPEVRPASPEDSVAVRRVCLLTGDAGGDASARHADPDLLGLVWAQPYLDLEPLHAFVAVLCGTVVGYVLGAASTTGFETRAESSYWPRLRAAYPPGPVQGRTPADENAVAIVHRPPLAPPALASSYPGHLHVDLLPEAQGHGTGRLLVSTVLASLAAAGCPAVHVGVDPRNEAALGFYRRLGFADLEPAPDVVHLGLGLTGPS